MTDPLTPPRLRDDCFAMPQGVSWVPVEEALARLRAALHPIAGTERRAGRDALGRVLAEDAVARRSNPPQANSAVDGYGFAHAATGDGRAAPAARRGAARRRGSPLPARCPPGQAIRILTGAILPDGVDTVVLEEDCATDGATVAFDGPVKPRANTRRAGEDVTEGVVALRAGHRLRPPDLALLAALGIAEVNVFRPLRVGVLSTGDEIVDDPGSGRRPAPDLRRQPADAAGAGRTLGLRAGRSWPCPRRSGRDRRDARPGRGGGGRDPDLRRRLGGGRGSCLGACCARGARCRAGASR